MKLLNFFGFVFVCLVFFSCSTSPEGEKTSPIVDGTIGLRSSGQSCDPGVPSGYILVGAQGNCCIEFQCKYSQMIGSCYRIRSGTYSMGFSSLPGVIPDLNFVVCGTFDGPDILIETVSCVGGSSVLTCDVFDNPC